MGNTRPGDRRTTVRVSTSIEIWYASDGPPVEGRIADMCEGGLFIDTTPVQPPGVGTLVRLCFWLPECEPSAIAASSRVVWTTREGMGVEFLDLSQGQLDSIRFYTASVFFGEAPAHLSRQPGSDARPSSRAGSRS